MVCILHVTHCDMTEDDLLWGVEYKAFKSANSMPGNQATMLPGFVASFIMSADEPFMA